MSEEYILHDQLRITILKLSRFLGDSQEVFIWKDPKLLPSYTRVRLVIRMGALQIEATEHLYTIDFVVNDIVGISVSLVRLALSEWIKKVVEDG